MDRPCACGVPVAAAHDQCGQTTAHLNTPVDNPPVDDPAEVEVTDSSPPLYGRRFALLSTRPRPPSVGYVFVADRDTMVLRIPQAATSLLMPPPEPQPLPHLTSHAIPELIACAEPCAVLCPATQLWHRLSPTWQTRIRADLTALFQEVIAAQLRADHPPTSGPQGRHLQPAIDPASSGEPARKPALAVCPGRAGPPTRLARRGHREHG